MENKNIRVRIKSPFEREAYNNGFAMGRSRVYRIYKKIIKDVIYEINNGQLSNEEGIKKIFESFIINLGEDK